MVFLQFYNQCDIIVYFEYALLVQKYEVPKSLETQSFTSELELFYTLVNLIVSLLSNRTHLPKSVCQGLMVLIGVLQINFYEKYNVY